MSQLKRIRSRLVGLVTGRRSHPLRRPGKGGWLPLLVLGALLSAFGASAYGISRGAVSGQVGAALATVAGTPSEINSRESSTVTVTIENSVGLEYADVALLVSGSAEEGMDYELGGGASLDPETGKIWLSFSRGETQKSFSVMALPGARDDVELGLLVDYCYITETGQEGPVSYDCGTGSSTTIKINPGAVEPEMDPVATISASDPDASKATGDPGAFQISLDQAARQAITVRYSVGGSATPDGDYRALSGSVTIPAGATSASIPVEPINDGDERDLQVVASLEEGSGYEVGSPSSATVTIAGADPDTPDDPDDDNGNGGDDEHAPVLSLVIVQGNEQIATGDGDLESLEVRGLSDGVPAAGLLILWSIESGEGSLSDARTTTGRDGLASNRLSVSGNEAVVVQARIDGTDAAVRFEIYNQPLANLPGLSGPQRSMATTLDQTCANLSSVANSRSLTGGEQDLLDQCATLIAASGTDPYAAARGVAALTPEQAVAPRRITHQVTFAQLDNIDARMRALRDQEAGGLDLTGLRVRMDGQSISADTLLSALDGRNGQGGGAGADTYEFERWGFFINGNIDWGNKDRSRNEDGFDFRTLGITAGIDYMLTDGLVLGFALGYGNSTVDIDANGGDLDADAWTATLYGTYYATEHLYLEGSASYGWASYDQTRNIRYSLLGDGRTAKADFDGDQLGLMIGAGYDFVRGRHIIDLYGRLRWIEATIDGYRERGANGLDLRIDSQNANSFRSILGAQYQTSISTAKAILVPQAWLEWSHEFEAGDDELSGHFVHDPARIPFALATDNLDSDFFRFGLGLGAQFANGRTAYITYEAALGMNNYREQSVNAGVRLAF